MTRFAAIGLFIFLSAIVQAQKPDLSITELESQLATYQTQGKSQEIARCHIQLGFLYRDQNNNSKAIEHFKDAVAVNESLGNRSAIRNLSTNLGLLYMENNNNEQALVYFKKSLKINEALGKKPDLVAGLVNIAQVYQELKNYSESNNAAEKAAGMAVELSDMISVKNCYTMMSENFEKLGNNNKAKEYFELAISIKGKLQKEELKKFESRTQHAESEVLIKDKEISSKENKIREITREQELMTQSLKQQKELSELKEREFQAKEKLQAIKQRNTHWIIGLLAVILFIVMLSLLFIFKQLRDKKKANALLEKSNNQIKEQKEEIEKQRDIAQIQKKKITDSIMYAKRIQNAAFPPLSIVEDIFPEYFLLYRPKDIVSGDFYWIAEKEGMLIVTVVDCTGHGVPGAFMSMLGIAFLNEIVNRTAFNKHIRTLEANEILNQLREHVIQSLHQSGRSEDPKDGMDMSLCIFDIENKQMQFAGAHNPVFIIRNGEQIILEADKMSIGAYKDPDTSFTNRQIKLQENDLIYITSDGYYDQIGGPKGHKMLSGNFRKYLLEIYQKPMAEQKKLLEEFYENWKEKREQTDDIMVLGIKFCPQIKMSTVLSVLLWPDKHFLIAEDTDLNYMLLVEALRPTMVKITRVLNGVEAVEACRKTKFDLVLMDINMPEMDGLEASRQIRKFDTKLPIIAHTAILRDDDVLDFKEAGCNDFISKPIDFKSFLGIISRNLFKNS